MGAEKLAVPVKELARYIREHFMLGLGVAAAVALTYGAQAFSTDFYIDAEVILNHPHTVYNWDQIGRFGLIALKYLIGNNWYNPYFEGALFLAVLWLLGMCFSYLFRRLRPEGGEGVHFIFVTLFLVFPTYADQFMFRFQCFGAASAMLLVALATCYFHMAFTEKNIWAYALAVVLDVFSFGIYQSMVNLQICFYIALYLFTMEKYGRAERKGLVCRELVCFLISLAVYGGIVKLFFDSGDYLSRQVGWLSGSPMSAVMNLLAYVKRVLLAMDVFYSIGYPVCVCACAAVFIWALLRDRRLLLPYAIAFAGMLASPFFLALATGTPSPYRAQCMLPFVYAVLWLYMVLRLRERGMLRYGLGIAVGCVLLCCQASVLARLFYTQDVIRDADRLTAAQLMTRIQEAGGGDGDMPIVFIGRLEAGINGSCYTKKQAASYLSYSVYEFAYIEGVPVDTPDYFNTGRILGYFGTMGFYYPEPTVEMVEEAGVKGADMGCWPGADCVRRTEDYIIVKLSD